VQKVEIPADALDLSVLWEVTNARLDEYHGIATGQARSSFRTAQVAITAGFLLLLGFAVLSFRTHSTAASITIAVLGGIAAGLAGYIGRTFIHILAAPSFEVKRRPQGTFVLISISR